MRGPEQEISYTTLRIDGPDDKGIARLTMAIPGARVNVATEMFLEDLKAAIDRLHADEAVRGILLLADGPAFLAGADFNMLIEMARHAAVGEKDAVFERMFRFNQIFSVLEKGGIRRIPAIAVIEGSALGGGLELALACRRRLAVDDSAIRLGLTESKFGVMPGAGGTQRLPRLIGAHEAFKLIARGTTVDVRTALELGIVDEIATPEMTHAAALRLIDDELRASESRGERRRFEFQLRGVAPDPNCPNQDRILASVRRAFEDPEEEGYEFETRAFVECLADPEVGAMSLRKYSNR